MEAPRALRDHGTAVSYLRLWRAVVEGLVPAQRQGRRWVIAVADLPLIAMHFASSAQ